MSYTNAVITGANAGGIFASIANIIAIYSAGGTQFSPLTFFIIAEVFLVVAFITCIQIYRNVSDLIFEMQNKLANHNYTSPIEIFFQFSSLGQRWRVWKERN